MIELEGVSFGYGRGDTLRQVSCRMQDGEVVGLIGPNGAGKSTLLRLCAGLLKPRQGAVRVDGRSVDAYRARAFARRVAFLPQSRPVPSISVQRLVEMGRFAHGTDGHGAVERALLAVGLSENARRDVRTLSGGQRQMAYLAMLLAQESPNVLLDEPLTHLDIGAQLDVIRVIRQMRGQGKCVAVVLHDLALLPQICDRALLVHQGQILFRGSPGECLLSPALEQAFGVRVLPGEGPGFERHECFT